jgi:N-acetylglucosamine kinase-like BadF-type ATPase
MSALYLGVDAGNSKTAALVCDESGRVLGTGRAGCGDIYGAGVELAVDAVLAAVDQALTAAGGGPADVERAAFRMAGVDWPEDHELWTGTIRDRLPGLGSYSVANDGFAAIRCGEASGVGVAVVAGSGSAVVGRGPSGDEWSMSFWIEGGMGAGGLVGDALHAVYRAALGLGPATVLTSRLLAYFDHADVERLLHGFTRRDGRHGGPYIAAAAPHVTQAAADGDAVAVDIVADHAGRYADYASIVATRVGFDAEAGPVPVVLAGSVLEAPGSPLVDAIRPALASRFAAADIRLARMPPVGGAALDALAEAGIALTPDVVAAVSESVSAAS